MLLMGFGGRKLGGGGGGMRRSSSLDMLAPPISTGMGQRNSSYTMLSNVASLMMSVSVPGHEHPYGIQAHQNRTGEGGYVTGGGAGEVKGGGGGEVKGGGGVLFYIKRKNPPAPGECLVICIYLSIYLYFLSLTLFLYVHTCLCV